MRPWRRKLEIWIWRGGEPVLHLCFRRTWQFWYVINTSCHGFTYSVLFQCLATPASPSALSSSTILDAILFSWPAWNIVEHFIHAMWRSCIAFPSSVSDRNWRIGYKRHFVNYKRRRRRRWRRRENFWSMDCWWGRIRYYGEERWERIFRWWWIVIRLCSFDPFLSSWPYDNRFLWKFTQGTLKVYKTTGKNNYVMLCEPGYISFGGGWAATSPLFYFLLRLVSEWWPLWSLPRWYAIQRVLKSMPNIW